MVGFTFIYASFDKILHPDQFARIVYNYKILPGFLINIFAITLPWVEFLAGIFVIVGVSIEASALILTFLSFVFMIAIGINIARGVDINCGCFTTDPTAAKHGASLLLRDILLLLAGILVFFYHQNYLSLSKLFFKNKKV